MKIYLNICFVFGIVFTLNSQVTNELKGCWLPEKYVKSKKFDDNIMFPIEGFEISQEKTNQFIEDFNIETSKNESSNIILIKTFKSEHRSIFCAVSKNSIQKYYLPHFYSNLNMKYISREVVEYYKKSKVYLSIEGDKLLVEIVKNNKTEKIYFVNHANDYVFENIADSQKFILNKIIENNIYVGVGAKYFEKKLSGNEKTLKLSYNFFQESDNLIIENQNNIKLYETGMISTKFFKTVNINIASVQKLIFKIESKQSQSKWEFKIELID